MNFLVRGSIKSDTRFLMQFKYSSAEFYVYRARAQAPASRALAGRRRKSEKQVIIGPIKNGSDQWNERRSEWQRDDENNN